MSLTYQKYLKLEQLLDLQQVESDPPEHDETLFIIIHQVYELWFRLMLHELDKIKRDFCAGDLYGAMSTFKRCRTIMKTLVGQLDVLETMTPLSFSSFRDRLESASGFQSAQFREVEFVLGLKRPGMLKHHEGNTTVQERLQRRLQEPSVVDDFYTFLEQRGLQIPTELRGREPDELTTASATLQQDILRLYKSEPELTILFELMTDFDEGLQEWRYRHVKMVERTIGNKMGTGGSMGTAFLRESLFRPVFPDLWAIRDKL